jgi:hypothetical protein
LNDAVAHVRPETAEGCKSSVVDAVHGSDEATAVSMPRLGHVGDAEALSTSTGAASVRVRRIDGDRTKRVRLGGGVSYLYVSQSQGARDSLSPG